MNWQIDVELIQQIAARIFEQHFTLLVLAGTLVLLLPMIMVSRRRAAARFRRERAEWQTQIESLRSEHRSSVELTVRIGRKLRDAEEQLRQLQTHVEALKLHEQTSDPGHSYAQAIRLVRRGADADRLVSDFGLTRGEAELVERLHSGRKAS